MRLPGQRRASYGDDRAAATASGNLAVLHLLAWLASGLSAAGEPPLKRRLFLQLLLPSTPSHRSPENNFS
ncbi:MAG: hypothetical protein AW08_01921 [Candidatus Accumulibacter adjunctus]|uniref:Uncharacterized protein n=1 Tax=Candidatus Accumulibacter adjunctus TaxID=1454001 RepID=A0A011MD23_9PROT|nr:MAG: hypothetical protein AW08_01921 [Candidatus Accumulibacter adjunctus]